MSIAFINGDSQYGSHVTFMVGGTRGKQIEEVVKMLIENDQVADFDFESIECANQYIDEVTDWESSEQVRSFLVKILTKDITCLNDDPTDRDTYFYLSEQSDNEWYKHFEYIKNGNDFRVVNEWSE